jgi:predicted Holliday junction resolvase-like endonuclease
MQTALPILLLLGLIGSLLITLLLAQRYAALRRQVDLRIQQQVRAWQEREVVAITRQQEQIARRKARLQLERWKEDQERTIRQDAIDKSRAVTLGKITEHFVPYLPGFEYNPQDARFLGSPVDFVVFDGLSDGEIDQVVFVEVKTGQSQLSTRERRIRDAIQAGRVRWIELRQDGGAAL